ncbi:MAG: hypothetical protein ACPG8W_22895 [Candidatus Promineifilaceae bacterium]
MTPNQYKHRLGDRQPLSQSILWQIQRTYFLKNGMAAWQNDEVPHTISCSPYMARTYGDIVFGYLHDCLAAIQAQDLTIDSRQPIYFVELGAGTGRLTYHFLHQFYATFLDSPFADWSIKFVLTDFAPDILAFWQSHPQLAPWVEAGLLDFAYFDAENPQALQLLHSQEAVAPDTATNPIILFANYFFDSIPQDSVLIEEGVAYDNRLTVSSTQPEPDLSDPTIWERMWFEYEVGNSAEYTHPIEQSIIDDYAANLPDTYLTFPTLGLACIRFWQRFKHVLLLTSDRGHTLIDALINDQPPLPNLHGSFSLMVNYHAIGEYVLRSGGAIYQAAHYQDNLQLSAYTLGPTPANGIETQRAFDNSVTKGGPDDFFAIQSALHPYLDTLALPQLLSLLRMSVWDAALFQDCFAALTAHAASQPAWHADIHDAALQVWQQYLPISADDPLETQIMGLLEALDLT